MMKNSTPEKESSSTSYAAPALEKGLDIIELLSHQEVPITQKDIANKIGRSVSEIYRMLNCLIARNYVTQIEDTYIITTKLFELANANPPAQRLLIEARPIMQNLSMMTDQSCHLTVYNQGTQVVVAKVDTPTGMGYSVRVGAVIDLLISASGRVLVAFQDSTTQGIRIQEALNKKPDHSIIDAKKMIDNITARGCEEMESFQIKGLYAISYPVIDFKGNAVAALTVPYVERLDLQRKLAISEIKEALSAAAHDLSFRIGGAKK